MESKKWVASVLVVLVGSPFAVAALDAIGISPFWEVEAPEWEAGYSWTFASSFEGEMKGEGGWMGDQSHRFLERGETHLAVLNTTARLGNESLYVVVEQYVPTKIVEDDEVRLDAEFDAEGEQAIKTGGNKQFYTQANLNPFAEHGMHGEEKELRLLDFPLRHGASWSVYRMEDDWGQDVSVVEELRARVAGKDVVHLPGVGSMDAVRIEATLTRESLDSIQDAVGAELASGTGPGMGMNMGMEADLDLDYTLTYWYAPEAKSIVRTDMVRTEDLRLTFAGESMRMQSTFKGQQVLSDYSLEPGPERSMDEIQRLWSYLQDLPGVKEISNQTWSFSIAASHYSVDTTQGKTTTLGVVEGERSDRVTLDFDAVPEGMQLLWRHRSLDDSLTPQEQWYRGAPLELTPQHQGLHEVTAYLLDDEDRLVGLDSTMIEGYARWEQTDDFVAGALLVSPDRSVAFKANVFMDHIRMEVDLDLGTGSYRLDGIYSDGSEDGQSGMVTSSSDFTMESLNPYLTSSWTASYSDQARLGPMTMSVEVRYDRDASFKDSRWMWDDVAQSPPLAQAMGAHCGVGMLVCTAMGWGPSEVPLSTVPWDRSGFVVV